MKTAQYTKSLSISLRPEIFLKIQQITDERQISLAEWVREAVHSALLVCKKETAKENSNLL